DPLDEQLDDRPAILPRAAFEPALQAILELSKLVDDPLLRVRLLVLPLGLRDARLALLLALLETLAPCAQLLERDRSRLVGVDQALDGLRQRPHLPRESTLLRGVSLEHRADLVALRFELGRELVGLLKPAREVLPHDLLDIVGAHRSARTPLCVTGRVAV